MAKQLWKGLTYFFALDVVVYDTNTGNMSELLEIIAVEC
jgi:hypothetical protein